jgi:hypothetical protein
MILQGGVWLGNLSLCLDYKLRGKWGVNSYRMSIKMDRSIHPHFVGPQSKMYSIVVRVLHVTKHPGSAAWATFRCMRRCENSIFEGSNLFGLSVSISWIARDYIARDYMNCFLKNELLTPSLSSIKSSVWTF